MSLVSEAPALAVGVAIGLSDAPRAHTRLGLENSVPELTCLPRATEIISIHVGQAGVQIGNACWGTPLPRRSGTTRVADLLNSTQSSTPSSTVSRLMVRLSSFSATELCALS